MKKIFFTLSAIAALALTAACEREIVIDNVDENAYTNTINLIGTLRDANTGKLGNVVDLRSEEYTTQVAYILPRAPKFGVDVTVKYDGAYVEEYNKEHGTSFAAFPAEKFTIQNGGRITMAPDEKQSYKLDITFQPFDDTEEVTYVLPLLATVAEGEAVKTTEKHLVYLVKNMSWQSMAARKPGQKNVFCYFEVNDTNPLNALQFETEEGQLLINYLTLFAYNINYDKEKGEVYCFPNPQCQYILDHYNEIIKPLRDRGVKVLIGLLGNHDESGLAQLSEIGCKDFAKKMAALCYGYGFDGINFDDEYSNSPDLSCPLFTYKSAAAGDRLIYECKKLMPDLLMTSYQYGSCRGQNSVDGVLPGEYLDITVADYGGTATCYAGMDKSQCAYMSSEFAQSRYLPTASNVETFMASDYGYWMVFAVWGSGKQGSEGHWKYMNVLAEGMLGSPLKKPSIYYPETRSLESKPITW